MPDYCHIRHLGLQDYLPIWRAMQAFTTARDPSTPDEFWFLEHPPVFTLGQNGKPEHVLAPDTIPVVRVDRGGQVTYHGPGQLVVYVLVDIRRAQLSIRQLVTLLEQSVVDLMAFFAVEAYAKPEAPGVYVKGAKIASLGLRVRRGCCHHGLSINVAMDLAPFAGINPCGYPGLQVTQLQDLGIDVGIPEVRALLSQRIPQHFGLTHTHTLTELPVPLIKEVVHA
jgi:lipoyl(octanoyl) transferase